MRDTANVYQAATGEAAGTVDLPAVLTAPIRPDHVRYIHTQMAKNARQAYAISSNSGYQTSAASWGTGRAVARIPRVSGGGTHRAGQAAFGNMCRGGGMYSPTKTYRRWHRCINITEKRHAVASALSAACVASIVMARGHKIDAVNEVPCIVSDEIEQVQKTKQAIEILKKLGCGEELVRIEESKTQRAGRGKLRGRRVVIRRGPLIVYNGARDQMNAFRNIPGVDLCHVDRLNLLQLAPGGSLGRFIIYSKSAIEQLGKVWSSKSGYTLPRPIMANADVARVINSDEIQSVLRPKLVGRSRRTQHKNLLTNHAVRCRVNPGYKVRKVATKKD